MQRVGTLARVGTAMALVLSGWAGSAPAQPLALTAPTPECRALESLVVFGLIDGGEGGDTSALSDVVFSGDSDLCLGWLDSYGYPGMWNPDCLAAFEILNSDGLPPDRAGQEVDDLIGLLAPFSPDYCTNALAEMLGQ